MERPYSVRTREVSVQTDSGVSPSLAMALKIEPSPTSFQSTSRGMGAHGQWLDTSGISAISGPWFVVECSSRSNADRMYWSVIGAQLKVGPRYPRSRES